MGFYEPSKEIRTFETTKGSGDFGETAIQNYLKRKYNCKIIDCSDNPEYRKKDIDFLYSLDGNGWTSVEVKTDNRMHQTHNIVVENAMFRRRKGRVNGWLYYCEANILCFIDESSLMFYFLNWKKLKALIFEQKWPKRWFHNGTDDCNGEVFVIPLSDLFDNNIVLFSDRLI